VTGNRILGGLVGRAAGLVDWAALRCPGFPYQYKIRAAYLTARGAIVGDDVRLRGGCRISGFALLEIGDNSGIAEECLIALGPGGKMRIGSDVQIGPQCYFRNANHAYDDLATSILLQGHVSKDIVIGSHVWIGARSIVLGGAHIGEYAIIGAGSVVSSEIPAYAVALGNPARVVRRRPGAAPPATSTRRERPAISNA